MVATRQCQRCGADAEEIILTKQGLVNICVRCDAKECARWVNRVRVDWSNVGLALFVLVNGAIWGCGLAAIAAAIARRLY